MADTSFVVESATLLDGLYARLQAEELARRRAVRRSIACAAVGVVHVLFVILLLASEWLHVPVEKPKKIEPMTWLALQQMGQAPKSLPSKVKKDDSNKVANPKLPPPTVKTPVEEENNAIDFAYALGRSLACGANSYEYLNSKMRLECKHKPWQFVYDRDGNIVLDARPRIPQEEKLRPGDIQAHERNTAPRCPQNVDPNAPCLADIIGGHR